MAFHASINNSFGKGSLIQLLRQFSVLHKDRRQVQVGFIGYPNAGKSSIINTLRNKKVCKVAPIPGETKVWQYITLMRRIFLIDCPGIVPPSKSDTDTDILLRGVVRLENVESPEQYIDSVLARCKPQHVERTYQINGWENGKDFLCKLGLKSGKLLKGGEPDQVAVAKMVIHDFIRGKLPWFVTDPSWPVHESKRSKSAPGERENKKRKVEGNNGNEGETEEGDKGDDNKESERIFSDDDEEDEDDDESIELDEELFASEDDE